MSIVYNVSQPGDYSCADSSGILALLEMVINSFLNMFYFLSVIPPNSWYIDISKATL